MKRTNVEIKARCGDPDRIRGILRDRGADFRGTDRQTDTYFRVPSGRLKLRSGNIENNLIFYRRGDQHAPKQSDVDLVPVARPDDMADVLSEALGVLAVVRKDREIYYIDNVKFHIDRVENLGSFVEIEAIDADGGRSAGDLEAQCRSWMELLDIAEDKLVSHSYSDLLSDKS